MKLLNRTMVFLYLAVATVPVVAMIAKVKDREVWGSVAPAPFPGITLANVRSENFQQRFTAWFESRLGLKGYAVTTDNALLYHVFGDTKHGSQVMLGKDGVLFVDIRDIRELQRDGQTQANIDLLAQKLSFKEPHVYLSA